MSEPQVDPWLVLRTRSRHEVVVEQALQRKDIVAYLPRRKVVQRRPGLRRVVEMPLFPGYLFVRPRAEQYDGMRYIRGSCGFVLAADGHPAPLPEKDVKAMKLLLGSDAPLTVDAQLVAGARVKVVAGPLTGLEGELVRLKSQHHLVINVALVSSSVRVEVDRQAVALA